MPSWKPVAIIALGAAVIIWLLFPGYVDLQAAPSPDEFRGVLGGDAGRAIGAAAVDIVFACTYALLGWIAYAHVSAGVPRWIGTGAALGAAAADQIENVLVLMNIQDRSSVTQSALDQMATAGSVKWGLAFTAIVLWLALAGQYWLESRRSDSTWD